MVAVGLIGVPFRPIPPGPPVAPDGETDPALYAPAGPRAGASAVDDISPVLLTTLKVAAYRTQAGDSLSRIAARFKLNIDTLVSWNGIRDARSIAVGTPLTIPNADGLKYTVRRGDTLQRIALSSGIPLNNILDWNRLSSSVISVGQEIFLPGARMNTNDLNRILGSLFQYPVMRKDQLVLRGKAGPVHRGRTGRIIGIDIVNKPCTPILAAHGRYGGGRGLQQQLWQLRDPEAFGLYQTLYGHLTRYLVTRGQKIRQGQRSGSLERPGTAPGPTCTSRFPQRGSG